MYDMRMAAIRVDGYLYEEKRKCKKKIIPQYCSIVASGGGINLNRIGGNNMKNIEIQKNEMKYEYIQAACAEAGDEVELFCISDNKQLKFTLPSSDEIEAFGLSLYREVTGNHVTGIIHYNDKKYKVTSIIKPDVNTQHTALLRELSCLVNEVFHFGFVADYFSYYISDYFNNQLCKNELDEILSDIIRFISVQLQENIINKKLYEFTDEDIFFLTDCFQKYDEDQLEDGVIILSDFFDDLVYTIKQIIQNTSITSLSENEIISLKAADVYAHALSGTALKVDNVFADNMYNVANTLLYKKLFEKHIPGNKIMYINKIADMNPYYYSMSLYSYVRITSDIKDISEGAFYGCVHLNSVSFEEGSAINIGKLAFASSTISSVSLPLSTKHIGEKAFAGCNIQTLIIPPTIERIDEYAFRNCKQLTEVLVLSKDTFIADNAFEGCDDKLKISYFENKEQKIVDKQETIIHKEEKILIDVVSPAYLIKNKLDACVFCNTTLENKDCILDCNKNKLKIKMLYCCQCNIYCINKSIIDEYNISRICGSRQVSSTTNIVGQIDISKMVQLPTVPNEILLKIKSSDECGISYQLVSIGEMITIEPNPGHKALIKKVFVNGNAVELPYNIAAKELKSINVEKKTLFPVKIDCLPSSLIITSNGESVQNYQLIEKGEVLSISENKSFSDKDPQSRSIVSVAVNSKEVILPYKFVVEDKVSVSAKYSHPIYIYVDKRLKISSSECKIICCQYESKHVNLYKISRPALIEVSSNNIEGCSIRSYKYVGQEYTIPSKIRIDKQAMITVNQVDNYYKLKISSSKISVLRNGAALHSGDTIQQGEILSVKLLDTSPKEYTVLRNGVAIAVPRTISVGSSDIVLELVSRNPIQIYEPVLHTSSGNEPQLNATSFLGDLGYSTSLGTSQRYEILQKAVRLYGKNKVINFLEYLIRGKLAQVNGARKYENAIATWRFDIQRVRNM